MDKEKYNSLIKEAEEKHKEVIFEIDKKYAISNNPYKKGDIIEDHIGKGRILKMNLYKGFNSEYPSIVYTCDNLLKSGKISKREPKRFIYQNNLLKDEN